MIKLTKEIEQEIRREGEKSYPNECCGVLLGASDAQRVTTVARILPIDNAREQDEQYHRFVISADDFLAAERIARRQELEVVGFYHSHPDHPARPSEYDRAHALPFYSYIIVAVAARVAGAFTSWRLSPASKQFEQEDVDAS
ncbi:M67 family metallopeptidase [Affinibrenneria salicis]|uniref:M67 family metallopeptidase n=1 Tax=Affinibrenneria salicis TaxID=2590031 RepID=A0A5J5G3C1_9GAMM|nr:M67 family metallopeptidase [Affinibrenneria salicis]KAA9001328.1 M67 family metallopeptidase [Affinibrenneria salicis]